MNAAATVTVSVLLAAAAAAGTSFALRPADPAPDQASLAELQRSLEALRKEHAALRTKFDAQASTAPPVAAALKDERSAAPTMSAELVGAAVEAYLQKRGGAGGATAAAAPAAEFDLDKELDLLRHASFDQNPELWKRLHAAGKGDEAIARLEALVKANPQDTGAQMDLAKACLNYMRVETGKYSLAIRADKAFDDVLAQDDKHWEARFTKAVSYSFWPPLTGKPKQAVSHLEKLVAQQESMPAQPHEANTYLILGNLLEQSDPARAREVWAKGARRHPENQDLARRLAEAASK